MKQWKRWAWRLINEKGLASSSKFFDSVTIVPRLDSAGALLPAAFLPDAAASGEIASPRTIRSHERRSIRPPRAVSRCAKGTSFLRDAVGPSEHGTRHVAPDSILQDVRRGAFARHVLSKNPPCDRIGFSRIPAPASACRAYRAPAKGLAAAFARHSALRRYRTRDPN